MAMQSIRSRTIYRGLSPKWLYGFLLVQFVCLGSLVIEELGSFRIGFRIVTFLASLLMMAALLTPAIPYLRQYTARSLALVFLLLLSMGMIHPRLNSPLAGLAHIGLNVAIWAPLFWVPRIAIDSFVLRRVMLLIWGFNTLSAGVGVLQVYFPERFMPNPQFVRQLVGEEFAEGLKIQLDNGESLFRPMGLSDSPGGAGAAGLVAFVTGLGFAVTDRIMLVRVLGMMGAVLGIFCIYISQVRASLVVAAVDLIVFLGIMALRGRLDRAAGLLLIAGLTIAGSFSWVMTVGSEAVGKRLTTLTEENAVSIYRSNRGYFLEETFEVYLPEFPLGAGLGRWGMMNNYFGNKLNTDSPPLWAEIQFTAWVYDGGLPLLLTGFAAVMWACYFAAKTALTARDPRIADMATLITSIHLGTLAQTFGYSPFIGQVGVMFWTLNATLFVAVMRSKFDSQFAQNRAMKK